MLRHALAIGVAIIPIIGTSARAEAYSGFTKNQGELFVKVAFSTFTSNDFYDLSGRLNDRGQDFTQRNIGVYAEYGIIEGLTATANIPALRINSYANTNSAVGFGDVQLALKYGVRLFGFHLAASVMPELPLGDSDATVQTDSGLNLVLPTGDGEFNVWSQLAVSRGFSIAPIPWLDGWVSAGAGFNLRTKGYAHQVGFGGELGLRFFDLAFVQGRLRGQIVPSEDLDTSTGFIYGEGTEFLTVGAGVAVLVPETPLMATFDFEVPVAGQLNLYSGPVFVAGIALSAG